MLIQLFEGIHYTLYIIIKIKYKQQHNYILKMKKKIEMNKSFRVL